MEPTQGNAQRRVSGLGRFYSDRLFFVKRVAGTLIVTLALIALELTHVIPNIAPSFSYWQLMLLPPSLFIGCLSATLIHNASHHSFRPRWLNSVVGEVCAFHQLYTFSSWRAAHLVHHTYADDPVRDPHPPMDMPFLAFSMRMRTSLRECLDKLYLEAWNADDRSRRALRLLVALSVPGKLARLVFWWLLLGPSLFLICYVPSLVGTILFFNHFNYYTHRPLRGGGVAILNLNETIYYKAMNRLLFGIYFHANHHQWPYLFNPQTGLARKTAPSA